MDLDRLLTARVTLGAASKWNKGSHKSRLRLKEKTDILENKKATIFFRISLNKCFFKGGDPKNKDKNRIKK